MISERKNVGRRASAILLVGTILGGLPAPLWAQETDPLAPQETPTPQPEQTPPATPAPAETPATTTPPAAAQQAPAAPAPVAQGVIRSIAVRGNQRLEPATIRGAAAYVEEILRPDVQAIVFPPSAQSTYPPAFSERRHTGTDPADRLTSGGSFMTMFGNAAT